MQGGGVPIARPTSTPIPLTHAVSPTVQDLHMQLRAKNTLIKQMRAKITRMNGTIPEKMELPSDDDWVSTAAARNGCFSPPGCISLTPRARNGPSQAW